MDRGAVDRSPMPLWNGALRFGLELLALAGLAGGGWRLGAGALGWLLAALLVFGGAALWGTFRVPGDPKDAPIAVRGWQRLGVEAVVLGGGALGLGAAFGLPVGVGYAAVVALHYATSLDRVRWLLRR